MYIQNQLCVANTNKKQWECINKYIEAKDQTQSIKLIKHDNKELIEPSDIAHVFNKNFSNIGPKLAAKIITDDISATQSSMISVNRCNFSFYLSPKDSKEVQKILLDLRNNSAGNDGIKAEILKKVADIIAYPIATLVKASFQLGSFPDALKTAIVTSIHKGKCKSYIENYRPVSVLITLSKVFERCMHKHLYNYLHEHDLIFKDQHGFWAGFSTDMALA